jgi:predicted hotdog family 3-hydroxylacyl-ACP dehydratase
MTERTRDLSVLLPHRPPMVLLDEVVDYGDDFAIGRVFVTPRSPFFDRAMDGVPAWVGIEYMAQTMAIWAADQQLRVGRPVNVAFLLGARRYRSNVPSFPNGAVLTVRSDTLFNDENNVGAFACRIEGGGILAEARLNAFRPDDPLAFVELKDEVAE